MQMKILLVEDNEGDILLTIEALEEIGLNKHVAVVKDGEKAIEFIGKCKDISDYPDLILLDYNLPRKNGLDVLHYIKGNDETKHLRVVMFTTSSSHKDILLSHQNFVNCYVIKPMDADSYMNSIRRIAEFWLSTAQIPKQSSNGDTSWQIQYIGD